MICKDHQSYVATQFNTPLGLMLAVANEQALCVLKFARQQNLKKEIERLKMPVVIGRSAPMDFIEKELVLYFSGKLKTFQIPFFFYFGSPFQKRVWQALKKIPYGETCSYAALAKSIGHPNAYRAVANANAANPLVIVIPCHRVIQSSGKFGGYDGGAIRKKFLIHVEGIRNN